ncbi:hypothetical protein IRY61_02595 [Candidatus Saccharibacteria bacterium]|nr:hypothetical protein [Candidatus Saccharibacteria bacterium]
MPATLELYRRVLNGDDEVSDQIAFLLHRWRVTGDDRELIISLMQLCDEIDEYRIDECLIQNT